MTMTEYRSNPSFLTLEAVAKRFGRLHALQDISLTVGADELVVVLGPTGAGKTTLLRTIVGLETPESGSIHLDGRNITALPPAARDVALVFQNFSLYPDWTVRRNLEFPLRAPGRQETPADIRERVRWAAELLHITPLLDRPAARLSGGEMQRVTIGRAIVRRPKLFLMDEPLTNLDAKLRERLRVELAVLRRELHIPMVYVTHDQIEALSMSDRIVVLDRGRILQTGTPEAIYRQPLSVTVARQLGQPPINLVPVSARKGSWVADDGSVLMPAVAPEGTRRLIGIRPEHIRLSGGQTPGIVCVVENMGAETVLRVRWCGQDFHLKAPPHTRTQPGDVLHPLVEADQVVFWDPTATPHRE